MRLVEFIREHKVVAIVVVIDIVVALIVSGLFVIKARKNVIMDISVAPSDTIITINGRKYNNGTAYRIEPGVLNIELAREGLEKKEYSVTAKDNEIVKIYSYLVDKEGGFSWYERNMDELDVLEQVAQDNAAREFLKKMSIVDILPFNYAMFNDDTLEYTKFAVEVDTIDCSDRFCLQAVNMQNSTDDFINKIILQQGYDLSNYEVYYF